MHRCAHQQEDVGSGDIRADRAGGAGVGHERLHAGMHLVADGDHPGVARAVRLQVGQIVLASLIRGDGEEFQQRRTGIRGVGQPVRGIGEGNQALADQCGDQIVFAGEVPEHRALGDPCATSDIRHRGLHAALGEHLLGGGQE